MAKNSKASGKASAWTKVDKASRTVSAKVSAENRRSTVLRATNTVKTTKSVDFERAVRG